MFSCTSSLPVDVCCAGVELFWPRRDGSKKLFSPLLMKDINEIYNLDNPHPK